MIDIGIEYGWKPGARYTNLRDVKHIGSPEFLDIDWKRYDFDRHYEAVKEHKPALTIARDVECVTDLNQILDEAEKLFEYANSVAIVPKDPLLGPKMGVEIPEHFIFGYSVKTKYGGTKVPIKYFDRPVHLLGGRPDVQRGLGEKMTIVSLDCNRFTLDARFGDFFNMDRFTPHPIGGYEACLRSSYENMNEIWKNYQPFYCQLD